MTTPILNPVLSPAELSEALQELPRIRLLDVRTPAEYQTMHVHGSYNVPLDTLGEHAREVGSVTDPVVLICQSGQRARRAEEVLKGAGMANLHLLETGVNGWVAAGMPVVRGAKRMSLERQVRIVAGAIAATGGFLGALVHPAFAYLAAFVGSGLVFAGVTDTCLMGSLLARLPYNRPPGCDVGAMVLALSLGAAPTMGRISRPVQSCGPNCA
jgi:rhodanese-related sulfurtransferase